MALIWLTDSRISDENFSARCSINPNHLKSGKISTINECGAIVIRECRSDENMMEQNIYKTIWKTFV